MIYTNINVIRLAEVLWSFSAAIEDLYSVCEEFCSSMIASCNDHRHQTYWWQQCPCNCKKMSPLLSFQGRVWGLGESLLELFPFRILDQLLRPQHRPWHVIKKPYQCIFLKKTYCRCILLFLVKECRREVLLSHCKTGGSLFCLFGLDSFIIFLFLVIQKYRSVVFSTGWSLTGVILRT